MNADPAAPAPSDAQAIDDEASRLMKTGIGLMSESRPDAVAEALALFDRALQMRLRLPLDDAPAVRFGLAACWLNRADALVQIGGASQFAEALRSYDAGIALAQSLPVDDDPRVLRRLAIAHQNRGLALQAMYGPGSSVAIGAFVDAVAVLGRAPAAAIPDVTYLQAGVGMNLANARAGEDTDRSWPLAAEAATRAVGLVAGLERGEVDCAAVALGARHVLCRAMARNLSHAMHSEVVEADAVHQATDVADEALELVRAWEQRGVTRFRMIGYDLFRFGARVYAVYQPHFLEEFVTDNLDPARSSAAYVESPEMQSAAREALDLLGQPDDRG